MRCDFFKVIKLERDENGEWVKHHKTASNWVKRKVSSMVYKNNASFMRKTHILSFMILSSYLFAYFLCFLKILKKYIINIIISNSDHIST